MARVKFHSKLCARYCAIYSVSKKSDPLKRLALTSANCTTLHIIKRARALMYFDYCHQIMCKSVVRFSRFSIFTKRYQKVQLPAALLACFLCAVTVFYVNVQRFFYSRDAMLARVIAIATCPSVRPSVRHAPVLCQNEESHRHDFFTIW